MKTAAYRVIEDMPEHQKLVGMESNSHIQSCKYCKPEMVALAGPEISPIKETYQWLFKQSIFLQTRKTRVKS